MDLNYLSESISKSSFKNDWSNSNLAPSGYPQNVTVRQFNETSVLIQWLPPTEHQRNGIISAYQVRSFFFSLFTFHFLNYRHCAPSASQNKSLICYRVVSDRNVQLSSTVFFFVINQLLLFLVECYLSGIAVVSNFISAVFLLKKSCF